ncbi:MAG TPA: hypothetical protein PLK13_11840 [Xanthobacteraceae bacterium]|jgi:hypothetical protein|nr:MAG: hypothetical protein B7Z41_03870 [Rhizobiales bacterium 12-66-7]HQS09504.1 hypothetical protein [Xanthobacteraceae bacterium]HQS46801.1 hypothetical protein [Xanthobacteraceae bacterium]
MTPVEICRISIQRAGPISAFPSPRRPAIDLPTLHLVELAQTAISLHEVATLAAELLAARERVFVIHTTLAEEVGAEAAQEAALARLTDALVSLGYVAFETQEETHGNAS